MSKFPQDIIADILTYLPVKSLIRFKCVCKQWRSLFSDPKFVKLHIKRAKEVNAKSQRLLLSTRTPQSVDFEAASDDGEDNAVQELQYPDVIRCNPSFFIGIFGSCNGLVCLFVDYEKIVLWNPSTRDSKELPNPSISLCLDFFSGLGYDSFIDDYKLVIASFTTTASASDQIMVEVFRLKTNMWKRIDQEISRDIKLVGAYQGIFCYGAVHWLGMQENGSNRVYVIVSFDIEEEKFKKAMRLPDHLYVAFLGVSGKCLCAFGECNGGYFEAWTIQERVDMASWRRLVRFPADRLSQEPKTTVLCLTNNGELLLDRDEWQLELYNPIQDKKKCISTYRDANLCDLAMYTESLVPFNDDENPEIVDEGE